MQCGVCLITTAAGDILKYFFFVYFSEKIRLDISCESSARQTIHMKCQASFFIYFLKLERRLPQYYLALESAKPLFFLGTAQGACCGKNTAISMAPDNVITKAIIYGILFSYSKPTHNVLSIGIPLLKLSILFLCKFTKKKKKKKYLLYTKCQNLFFFFFFVEKIRMSSAENFIQPAQYA